MGDKNCMFQYATKHKIYEDTDLITRAEADALWDKYYESIQEHWDEVDSPQMCIWINCDSNVNYHETAKDIDFRDCELDHGKFYRIKKELI